MAINYLARHGTWLMILEYTFTLFEFRTKVDKKKSQARKENNKREWRQNICSSSPSLHFICSPLSNGVRVEMGEKEEVALDNFNSTFMSSPVMFGDTKNSTRTRKRYWRRIHSTGTEEWGSWTMGHPSILSFFPLFLDWEENNSQWTTSNSVLFSFVLVHSFFHQYFALHFGQKKLSWYNASRYKNWFGQVHEIHILSLSNSL